MDIYELIGFIMGDGNIYYSKEKRKYRLELCGNVEEDKDYFNQLFGFLLNETGKKPLMFVRNEKNGRSLRIQFNNKRFVEYLINLGVFKGKKTFTMFLPDSLLSDGAIMHSILRGLFEADGCLYFSKSKNIEYPSYPRLEIQNSSEVFVKQINAFLNREGFITYVRKGKNRGTFAILISGEKMLEKWRGLIGFVSLKNESKYQFWKAKGFYMPHTPLKDREKLCAGGTTVLRPM